MPLDLVIPAHNEADRIGPTIAEYLDELGSDDRILVALDSCTDRTAEVVAEAAGGDLRVVVHEYPKLGKGGVIIETFRRCTADMVGFVDADGATPPAELVRLQSVVEQEGLDGAIAGRRHASAVLPRSRPWLRRLTSAGFAFGVKRLFGLPFADTQCGAKVLRRSVVEACLPLLSARDFLFDVDLLLVADRLGARVAEIPTVWIDRERSRVDVMRDSRRMALSSFSLWLHHQAVPVPSRSEAAALHAAVPGAALSALPVPSLSATADSAAPDLPDGADLARDERLSVPPAPALRALPEPNADRLAAAALRAAAVRIAARPSRGAVGGDA